MLPDKELQKLCFGRIIRAPILSSAGTEVKERYAVMVDSDEEIAEHKSYWVVPISHNDKIDPTYMVQVPKRTGLTGNVICSLPREVHEVAITWVGTCLTKAEMKPIMAMIAKHQADKVAQNRLGPSTQS
jgi:hypothetical protein